MTQHRHRRLPAIAAMLVAASLIAAGCSTADSSNGSGSTEPGPGVTDTTVKVGFVTLKPSTAGGGSGFNVPDYGDLKKQVKIVVDKVNDEGGIAGRKVTPVIREFDASTDSVQKENDLCTAFTEEDGVFAVVLLGQREPSARSCYQKANTVMIDVGGVALSQSVYEGLSPYLWAPSYAPLDTYAKAMVATLEAEDFFGDDAKIGLFVEKESGYQSVANDVVKPALESAGVTDITTADFDTSSNGALGASAGAAVNSFKAAGVNRVIFLGRGDMVGFFTSIAAPQQFAPRLAIGTYEDPEFAALNPAFYPPAQMKGAVGIGFLPTTDGIDEGFPAAGPEQDCIDTLKAGGETFADRADAKRALMYCDAVNFLSAVGAGIGSDGVLNADGIAGAAATLGDTFKAAAPIATTFGEGVYAPASSGRTLTYSDGGFTYTSDAAPFPS